MTPSHRWSAASFVILLAAACGDGVTDPVVTSVTVTPDSALLAVSETITLSASALDASGAPISGQTTIWTSNDPDVATVDDAGVVTAVAPGNVLIQANVRGIRGSARIIVVPGPAAVLIVAPDSAVVDSGTTRAFEADVQDAFGNPTADTVSWTTADPAVATVDPVTGEVTGVGPGTTLVIAAAATVADTATIRVESLAFNQISAGGQYTCATSNGFSIYCWGDNTFGVLGQGTTSGNQTTFVRVPGGTEYTLVSAGQNHTCGLSRGGAAVCWGRNNRGQVGDNTTTTRPSPTFVGGNLSFTTVDVGSQHSCALIASGAGYCWGNNGAGQLGSEIQDPGLGAPPPNPLPIAMQASPAFAVISIGANHGCGLTSGGLALCWGDGSAGALGDDTTLVRSAPVNVSGGRTYTAIAAGDDFSCGISAGTAYCWGDNTSGQLGTGDSTSTDVPVAVNTGLTFTAIAAGTSHACALTASGDAYCWGDGTFGQLGDGNTGAGSPTPTAVLGGLSFGTLSVGGSHTCGITTGGVAYCWGRNTAGQLGDGGTADASMPVRVAGQ